MSDEAKTPLSVQFGATAKFDVKAEIPKEATGNLLAALTDIIRPFSEKRGLRADQIRLQREDVLLQIATKARKRAELEQIELNPVPNKLLVPFLEKASLEDFDEDMKERWAALLLSASKSYHAEHLTFVDILSRVSSDELNLLERVCFSYKGFPETYYPGGHAAANKNAIMNNADILVLSPKLQSDDNGGRRSYEAYTSFAKSTELTYGGLLHVSVRFGEHGSGRNFYGDLRFPNLLGDPPFPSLEILDRERLVQIESLFPAGAAVQIDYFNVTYLGIRFVRNCSPRAAQMAARRPAPNPVGR